MSWADFTAMLADAAQSPSAILALALCIFVAGLLAGVMAGRADGIDVDSDAGDTHAGMPPLPRVQRVRAGRPVPILKPSYDGRKATPKA